MDAAGNRMARGGVARRLLALSMLCAMSVLAARVAVARAATAVEPVGAISGTVTDASTGAPLKGIEVCAIDTEEQPEEEEEGRGFACTKTEAHGHYELGDLYPEEGWEVIFEPPVGSHLNYITQYYEDAVPPAEPTELTVLPGKTLSGIDEQLSAGAQISGRVTDAATGAPVAEATVDVLRAGAPGSLEVVSSARSDSAGHYDASGLPSGAYDVLFVASGFNVQYYKNAAAVGQAATVAVTAPSTVAGIDAALVPGVSSPPTLFFRPSAASPPAHAKGGPSGSKSPGEAGVGTLSLLSTHVAVAHGVALVRLRCGGAGACQGKVTLKMNRELKIKDRLTRREETIAKSAALSLAPASEATISLKLDAAGVRALGAARGHLKVGLALASSDSTRRSTVILVIQRPGSGPMFVRVPIFALS